MKSSIISDTLIIIPAFNEAKRIARVVRSIYAVIPGIDILVIDDGSRDQTIKAATEAGAKVAPLPYNMGYGVAVQTGYRYANRLGYKYVVQMDADGQHEPRCIPDLLTAVTQPNVDIVLGSRWLGAAEYNDSRLRKFGKFYFGFLASLLTPYNVTDPTTGFQALTDSVVNFFCSDVYPSDYPDADVIIMLYRAGFRVQEQPVVMYQDDSGQSMHSGLKPIYYGIKMMMSILMTIMRDDNQLRKRLKHG
ncbi:MAG: glycosyltransferase family 2 protein [Chloroflexi bacterium]|nr:glycosyltransferase family 2 protein [Chloroflexota bacterium]